MLSLLAVISLFALSILSCERAKYPCRCRGVIYKAINTMVFWVKFYKLSTVIQVLHIKIRKDILATPRQICGHKMKKQKSTPLKEHSQTSILIEM